MDTTLLQESTLVEAIMHTRSQIDVLWQVFITVHIALFALLFIYSTAVDKMNALARVFAVAGISLFDWINGKALTSTYLLLDAMQDQYRTLYGQVERFQPKFYEHFVLAQYADRPDMVLITHGLAFAVVVVALIARKLIHTATA
ncbi:MAG: hypothetical protein KDJ37_04895 [Hyphomicrobiaceae bacterium]|nr:hypothetical protein [Hyphomicrobiaceae bacterium]